jgi:hypothetical protein
MELAIREFLEANRGKPKVILLGEDHGGGGTLQALRENVGKELAVIRTLRTLGQSFFIYSELSTDLVSNITPQYTQYYLKQEAYAHNIPFKPSHIGSACRAAFGSCDDLYQEDIMAYLDLGGAAGGKFFIPKSELVVAAVGLLHATDIEFPETVAVLRLNCSTREQTYFALTELRKTTKKHNSNTANKMERNLPYIIDPAAVGIGYEVVPESAKPKPSYFFNPAPVHTYSENVGAGKETFKPEWVKNKWGDWVAKCPLCGGISGRQIQQLTHKPDCPNSNKAVDVSEKPAEGGKRRKKHTRRKLKSHKKRRTAFKKRSNY